MNKALAIVGSSRSNGEREANDFYPTPAYAVEALLGVEDFAGTIIEPCCGSGDISRVLLAAGFDVTSRDLVDRGFGEAGVDYLACADKFDNVITNPPYALALDFVEKSKVVAGRKIAMLLKLSFLESEKRRVMFTDTDFALKKVWVFSKRLTMYKAGVPMKNSGMIAYAWYVWERGYVGEAGLGWV